jgi:hypothetical protein
MELVDSIIQHASPYLVGAYWVLVVAVGIAAYNRGPRARKFLAYVANTGEDLDEDTNRVR